MDLMRDSSKFIPGQIHINRDRVNVKIKSIINSKRMRMRKLVIINQNNKRREIERGQEKVNRIIQGIG